MPRYSYTETKLPSGVGWHIPSRETQLEELKKLAKLRDVTLEARDASDEAESFRRSVDYAYSFAGESDWVTCAGTISDAIELAQKLVKSSQAHPSKHQPAGKEEWEERNKGGWR